MLKIQIARILFLNNLKVLKATLSLLEFKLGKSTEDYRYAKQQIMDYTYKGLTNIFKIMTEEKILVRCECGSKLRQGFKPCEFCSGAGYKNKEVK